MKTKKIPYVELLPLLLISFVMYKVIDSSATLSMGLSYFVSLFSYFIWAFAFAYLLNPIMKRLDKLTKNRVLTLVIIYTMVIGLIMAVIFGLVPQIVDSIRDFIEKMPQYIVDTEKRLSNNYLIVTEFAAEYGITEYLQRTLLSAAEQLDSYINTLLSGLLGGFIVFTSTFFKILAGLVISIYMLKDKEKLAQLAVKCIEAIFVKEKKINEVLHLVREINGIFSTYFTGKLIDSLIIGILCYVGLIILNIPYAIIIALIIGITNMIPYFGPIIGAVPAVIITLFAGPNKALATLILILVLQQFDGWYLGPRILGVKVGLNPIWIILAITLGGGLYGAFGMFIGVPVMAVIKIFATRFIDARLKQKETDAV